MLVALIRLATPAAAEHTSCDLTRIHNAAAQLVRSQLPSGFFPYDFDFRDGKATDMDFMAGFNLVRQSGAAFSLAEYHAKYPSEKTRQTLVRFLAQVSRSSLPIGKGSTQEFLEQTGVYNRWQLWKPLREPLYALGLLFNDSGPGKVVSVQGDYERAWTGATAFSLLTALKYREVEGVDTFDKVIWQWKQGLLALHVRGRGFREAPHYLSESAYFNAEAWLALAAYAQAFPADEELRPLINELDNYMTGRYGTVPSRRFYSWGTMAAVIRADSPGEKRFSEFVVELAKINIASKELEPEDAGSCASIEGLATFLTMMQRQGRADEPISLRVSALIKRQLAVIRELQLNEESAESMHIKRDYLPELSQYAGAFVMSMQEPVMEVALTGHCLNALLLVDGLELSD